MKDHYSRSASDKIDIFKDSSDTINSSKDSGTPYKWSSVGWSQLVTEGIISTSDAELFQTISIQPTVECGRLLKDKPSSIPSIIRVLSLPYDRNSQAINCLLKLLYEYVREDLARYETLSVHLRGNKRLSVLLSILESHPETPYADKAAYLLSGLISRAPWDNYTIEEVQQFAIDCLGDGLCAKYHLSITGKLDLLTNLLKNDANRAFLWAMPYTVELLSQAIRIGGRSNPAHQYKSVFSLWLLSYNPKFLDDMVSSDLVEALCKLIKETRVEKIVRVSQHALGNMLENEGALEIIIDNDVMQVLGLLEFEKWKDHEVYEEIRNTRERLSNKIKTYSNFDRYCHELESGRMKWGVLHLETFWHENFRAFETNEFEIIKKIVTLLEKENPTTLCVACHDLGEFARMHPAGKKIAKKLHVKEKVMPLLAHRNREVAREALLCIQKLVLNDWKVAAESSSIEHEQKKNLNRKIS